MATRISNLKDANGDNVYPITKVECVYNDSNQNVSDLLGNKADKNLSNIVPTRTSESLTINGKAGTKYTGAHICIESWVSTDGTQWYRKYDDGWMECGGTSSWNISSGLIPNVSTLTFPLSFTDLHYNIQLQYSYPYAGPPSGIYSHTIWTNNRGAGSIGLYTSWQNGAENGVTRPFVWYACGY